MGNLLAGFAVCRRRVQIHLGCAVLSLRCDFRMAATYLLDSLRERLDHTTRPELYRLNAAICELIDDWSMVQFLPSDPRDSDTIDQILAQMDHATQYHEDVEPRIAEDDDCGKDEAD